VSESSPRSGVPLDVRCGVYRPAGVSEISRSTVERVASEMFRADGPDVVLLLGAGASRKSGISTADEIAEWAAAGRTAASTTATNMTRK
jgi:hypothetical protein